MRELTIKNIGKLNVTTSNDYSIVATYIQPKQHYWKSIYAIKIWFYCGMSSYLIINREIGEDGLLESYWMDEQPIGAPKSSPKFLIGMDRLRDVVGLREWLKKLYDERKIRLTGTF